MAQVEIYTTMLCGFCARAKMLLKKKGVPFSEIKVGMDAAKRAEMEQRSGGGRTVPQIFIDGKHVGGCDELEMLEFDGELDQMLNS
jgi:glutaredoxin 3